MIMLNGVLILLVLVIARVQADHGPYFKSAAYDEGKFGEWPTETYRSSPIIGPALNYLQYSDECKDGLYTFIAPRGNGVANPGPMILDQDGHLVWTKRYGQSYNLNVYTFKGQDYLTFWMGNDGVGGHGEGAYYMLDSSYREVYKINAANHLPGDLHEFHITQDDTALITIYDIIPADLSAVGGLEEGWIWDGTFQELDIETGKTLFQWRASEHFNFTDMKRDREGNGDSDVHPWDFFHINSVDKDTKGNYLISSRYASCLTYIDGRTGDVIWRLGGKNNDFTDLSDGAATNFAWQHHARFRDNGTAITVFDNASRGAGAPELPSRGLYLDIDQENMTVKVRHEYWNPDPISSQSQGSIQLLTSNDENTKVLVGYGHIPTWTEYASDGTVLCNTHFGAASGDGNIMSYRVLKYPWVGHPTTSPDISVYNYTAAASWNGATEVVTWALEGADSPNPKIYTFIAAVPKSGFETVIPIPVDTESTYIRAHGLNSTGHILGTTKLVRWDPDSNEAVVGQHDEDDGDSSVHSLLFFFGGFASAVVLAFAGWFIYRRFKSRAGAQSPEDRERGSWQPLDRFNGDEDLSDGEMDDVEFALLGRERSGSWPEEDDDDRWTGK
ncbi:ASST-domain-containing protein [Aspergillus novoparasiticus]|uniref:ASST-domain-containing protein n=1 Tax=Aspergillus novoparasiticus TaxID=986946 RepID=A0A5N6F7G6_9EURO|nr:ASST-domain-containing protein [Aspergillus novoparasiticus]